MRFLWATIGFCLGGRMLLFEKSDGINEDEIPFLPTQVIPNVGVKRASHSWDNEQPQYEQLTLTEEEQEEANNTNFTQTKSFVSNAFVWFGCCALILGIGWRFIRYCKSFYSSSSSSSEKGECYKKEDKASNNFSYLKLNSNENCP